MVYGFMNCGIRITGKKHLPANNSGKKPTLGKTFPDDMKVIEQILGDNGTGSCFKWTRCSFYRSERR